MYKGTFNNRMKAPKIFNDNLYVLFSVVTFNEVIRPIARHKKNAVFHSIYNSTAYKKVYKK